MPAESPQKTITIVELFDMWASLMPPLRDQGEADQMNFLLGAISNRLRQQGKTVPPMVFITDTPADPERTEAITTEWFALAYERWWRTPLFRRFWDALSDDEKKQFFHQIPKG
jgi:hypothetical protein